MNLSSIYGSIAPRFEVYEGTAMTMPVEYAAIKSSLQHLTRYVNAYMKGTAFRANCVSPGGILAGQDPRFLERYGRFTMRKGMLDAQDVVGAVLYALSDASRYMVGQNIVVDDGFSLWLYRGCRADLPMGALNASMFHRMRVVVDYLDATRNEIAIDEAMLCISGTDAARAGHIPGWPNGSAIPNVIPG